MVRCARGPDRCAVVLPRARTRLRAIRASTPKAPARDPRVGSVRSERPRKRSVEKRRDLTRAAVDRRARASSTPLASTRISGPRPADRPVRSATNRGAPAWTIRRRGSPTSTDRLRDSRRSCCTRSPRGRPALGRVPPLCEKRRPSCSGSDRRRAIDFGNDNFAEAAPQSTVVHHHNNSGCALTRRSVAHAECYGGVPRGVLNGLARRLRAGRPSSPRLQPS